MSERAYTVGEIDALRSAVEQKWLFGEPMTLQDPRLEPLSLHETLRYPCGCEASGTYPLPTYCPTHGTAPETQGKEP
jgi:hypothetical protein